jgi:hypothetical protein
MYTSQKVLEKESQRRANAAEHMKMLYQQEASRKSERIVTVLEGPVNPSVIGGRGWNFGRRGGGSAAGELLWRPGTEGTSQIKFIRADLELIRPADIEIVFVTNVYGW